jgi:hypothetical protein
VVYTHTETACPRAEDSSGQGRQRQPSLWLGLPGACLAAAAAMQADPAMAAVAPPITQQAPGPPPTSALKILLLGDEQVGKTSLLQRMATVAAESGPGSGHGDGGGAQLPAPAIAGAGEAPTARTVLPSLRPTRTIDFVTAALDCDGIVHNLRLYDSPGLPELMQCDPTTTTPPPALNRVCPHPCHAIW